jgi:hypothetical protein
MGIPTGIGAQFGYAAESTWGTIVTPDHFLEFDDESLQYQPTWLEGTGLKSGRQGKPASRAVISRYGASGDITMDMSYNKLGALLKAALGSSATATQIGLSGIYKQVHALGDPTNKSLTVQIGRPQASDGVVKPFTYPGAVVTEIEFSVSDGELGKVRVSFDAKDEATATGLASASYIANSGVFKFSDINVFKVGGTPSTASNVTSIASGVSVASIVKSFSVKLTWPKATERYGLGNAGAKAQQLQNGLVSVTGSLGGEFNTQAEFYDVFKAQTTTAMQLTFNGAVLSTSNYAFDIILPACKYKMANPDVNGPDVVQQQIDFEAYDNAVDNQIQVTYQSSDTAL